MSDLTPEELGNMEIDCPPMSEQLAFTYIHCTKEGISQLEQSLSAAVIPNDIGIKEEAKWFLDRRRWSCPPAKAITAYFDHFIRHYPQYEGPNCLSSRLRVDDDMISAYRQGSEKIPYDIWRNFLVITGRMHQEILDVVCRVRPVMKDGNNVIQINSKLKNK
jgi:hypothetical protein